MFRWVLIFLIVYQVLSPRVSSAIERPEDLPTLVRASIQCVTAFAAMVVMKAPDHVINTSRLLKSCH